MGFAEGQREMLAKKRKKKIISRTGNSLYSAIEFTKLPTGPYMTFQMVNYLGQQ